MLWIMTAACALVPSVLLMWYFHARDRFAEPVRLLWKVAGLGVVAVIPILIVAWPVSALIGGVESPILYGLLAAFLEAAVPEEVFKLVVIWFYALRHREFDEPMDGVVYGVAASLGFATFENVLYVLDAGLGVAVTRALTAVPGHAFLGAIMGYYAARAKLSDGGSGRWLGKALVIPILLHGIYDFPLIAVQRFSDTGVEPPAVAIVLLLIAPLCVLVEWLWAVRLTRRLRAEQDRKLAPGGQAPETSAAGWLGGLAQTLAGGVLAGCGALVVVFLLLALGVAPEAREEPGWVLVVAGVLGALPMVVGGMLFRWGIRRLNAGGARSSSSAPVLPAQ